MYCAVLHLPALLAVEKSKTAFYIAGGLLALWALFVSLGLGLRMPDFPRNAAGQRLVIFVSVLLVAAAMSTAVLTSGVPATEGGVKAVTGSESAKPAPASAGAVGTAPGGKATASTLALAADPSGQLRYDKQTLKAPAGKVTIDFTNSSPSAHNVTVVQGSKTLGATPVKTGAATLSLNLQPGTYTYYCSVPGHRAAGMQGTLTIS
jgi:plastocyanin